MDMRIQFSHTYQDIISLENLLEAWKEFARGKRNRKDVQEFERNLMSNILSLYNDLSNKSYKHLAYEAFSISDPKPRNIHKASVRDRLLHHAVYRVLYPYFDKKFTTDSFSCRKGKGTHKAMTRLNVFADKVSRNNTKTIWTLKCDIKKFFASIDQKILISILAKHIHDQDTLKLLEKVVGSFCSTEVGKGLPLGNLTSQLLVNIYMNEFDQWMKHKLKAQYYIRYADDFVIMHRNKKWLEELLLKIKIFLHSNLKLSLHPDKVSIKTLASGVDFLGFVHFPKHRVLRTATKKRMFKKLIINNFKKQSLTLYEGMLRYGNCFKLKQKICLEKK